MSKRSQSARTSKQKSPKEINLVSARTRANPETGAYSRRISSDGYSRQRQTRSRRKKIIIGVAVGASALLLAVAAGLLGFYLFINGTLTDKVKDLGDLDSVLTDRVAPEDPFYMLLIGTDGRDDGEPERSDTLILARIDPGNRSAALISIPRDTRVYLEGYGYQKINAAYAYGDMERQQGNTETSGAKLAIETVSKFAGVDISSFAQIDFSGFKEVVNALGGVEVDVPVDIVGDLDAEGPDIYAGNQVLDGDQALVFCRSRAFDIGDYQRQANQRTFLQALAKQVLAADPITIASTVTKVAEMVTTDMDVNEIISVASSMQGLNENDIQTYTVPSSGTISPDDGLWYEYAIESEWKALIEAINAGEYPQQDVGALSGEVPDSYKSDEQKASDQLNGQQATDIATAEFVIVVRNGYGEIEGAASAVAAMLESAGYEIGEIGNTNAAVYNETLIVHDQDSDEAAAEDIKARLGYGRIIPSLDRYAFEGNVLVIVGGDYEPAS